MVSADVKRVAGEDNASSADSCVQGKPKKAGMVVKQIRTLRNYLMSHLLHSVAPPHQHTMLPVLCEYLHQHQHCLKLDCAEAVQHLAKLLNGCGNTCQK